MQRIIFQGIHLLADLECDQCGLSFYHDFPVGHGITYPAIVDKKNMQVIQPAGMEWYTTPLVNSLQNPEPRPVAVAKKVNRKEEDPDTVILFNCLDAWYGHVLLKLINVQFYHDHFPAYKLIVLVPAGFTWMVPDYVHETWSADIKLRDTTRYFVQLEKFIREELQKYKTVYHAGGYAHPPLQRVRVHDFFREPAFDLDRFSSAPAQIMFVYREDRPWLSPFQNRIFNLLNRKKIKFANSFFYRVQVKKINRLAKKIRACLPQSRFIVCGIGKFGQFSSHIIDERATTVSEEQELAWCKLYAGTHLVIGVHGSNMLIPSALAAAWIEILPDDRMGNVSQDLFCKYDFNNMVFLGRFASPYDPVARIAGMACGMITDYESFARHQVNNFTIVK